MSRNRFRKPLAGRHDNLSLTRFLAPIDFSEIAAQYLLFRADVTLQSVLRIRDFWYGSDPYLRLTDPDPAIFISDLQDANKKYYTFFLINFWIYTSFVQRLKAVLRIHDILMWIQIRESMPLTNGSGFGSGSFYFHHLSLRCQLKTNLKKICSAYYFFKDKKSKEVTVPPTSEWTVWGLKKSLVKRRLCI